MNSATGTDCNANARCFLALLPDAATRTLLQRCRDTLQHAAASATRGVHWVEPGALHLTLRFFGASTTAQIEYFKHVLPTLAPALPALEARRYGIWPNRARPRLLVLELKAPEALAQLAGDCETHARKAGFEPEPRDFRAHITLARLRPGCAFGILPGPPRALGFEAIALMRSQLALPAAAYTELAREPLGRGD